MFDRAVLQRLNAAEERTLAEYRLRFGAAIDDVRVQPPSPGAASPWQAVLVSSDGGSEGDAATPCTTTYRICALGGDISDPEQNLAVGLTPYLARTATGRYLAAPTGTLGVALHTPLFADGAWTLIQALKEVPFSEVCA